MDLITLGSPCPPDDSKDVNDFEDIWNTFEASCDLRGWCSASIGNVIRRLQSVEHHRLAVIAADLPPFIGRLRASLQVAEACADHFYRRAEDHDGSQ